MRTIELAGAATKGKGAPGADFFVAIAQGMHQAYEERLKTMGDKPTNTCTTHFCAADSEGNMVALTQTLMSLFGSCVMLPKTGITMNNGMLWFDPEPNRPNSIAPGKRPLCNICPVVVAKDGKGWFCIGASGGRRIVPAVAQLSLMLIDRGLDVEAAFHQPRIDVSGVGPIRVNRELPDAVKKVVVLDACHSGGFLTHDGNLHDLDLTDVKNLHFMAAASEDSRALTALGGTGVFTDLLVLNLAAEKTFSDLASQVGIAYTGRYEGYLKDWGYDSLDCQPTAYSSPDFDTGSRIDGQVVPEPSSILLLLIGSALGLFSSEYLSKSSYQTSSS
jgi:hypothetical protein